MRNTAGSQELKDGKAKVAPRQQSTTDEGFSSYDAAFSDPETAIGNAGSHARDEGLRREAARPHSYPSDPQSQSQSQSQLYRSSFQDQRKYEPRAPEWHAHKATRPLLLTFDAFDTLFTPKNPIHDQYATVARTYGFDLDPSAIASSFKAAFKDLSSSHPNYGKATNTSVHVWWSHIINNTIFPLLPTGTEVPSDLIRTLYDRFSSHEGYTLFADVMPFLSLLGQHAISANAWPPKRTMLGILSNSDPRVRNILESFNIPILPSLFPPRYTPHTPKFRHTFGPATFGFATLSYEAGAAKPDRMIFDQAIRDAQRMLEMMAYVARLTRSGLELLADVRKEFHVMHVGDEVEKDVIPALRCGWDAVLLDRQAEEEVSWRSVELDGGNGVGIGEPEVEGSQGPLWGKRTVQYPVINNLLALRDLVTKGRLEDGGKQQPVWVDESRPFEKLVVPRKSNPKRFYRGRRVVQHPFSTQSNRLAMLE